MSNSAVWKKLGLCFVPSGTISWMRSHAAVPIAEWLDGDRFKIYFTTRDERNRSFTGYVIIDINRPTQVLALSEEPVLSPGALGEFDDSGAMASWLTSFQDQQYLYYIGWNLGTTVPFRNSVGMAQRGADGVFSRMFPGPVLDRTRNEPHFCASCCVIPGSDCWRMWYLSCTGWHLQNGKPEHAYHIKYAESHNGIDWDRQGQVAIDYAHAGEYAISRPTVLCDEGVWKMWYSYRGETYRIGYAESADGRQWTRLDTQCGIDVSASGWDSQMIEYPFVFDHEGRRYMLYNGNDYGRTGFGLAVLEHS